MTDETAPRSKNLPFKGKSFKIPAKMPFNAMQYLSDDMDGPAIFGVLRVVLGDDQMQRVEELNLTLDDGVEFVEQVIEKLSIKTGK